MFKSYYIEDINFCRANICEFSEFWSISLKSKIKFRIFLDAFNFCYHKLFTQLISLTNLKFSPYPGHNLPRK